MSAINPPGLLDPNNTSTALLETPAAAPVAQPKEDEPEEGEETAAAQDEQLNPHLNTTNNLYLSGAADVLPQKVLGKIADARWESDQKVQTEKLAWWRGVRAGDKRHDLEKEVLQQQLEVKKEVV